MNRLLWTPSKETVETSRMEEFRRWVNRRHNYAMEDYPSLYRWSTEHSEEFWADAWDYFDIIASERFSSAAEHAESFQNVKWFPGAKLNYTENMLRYTNLSTPAIIFGEKAMCAGRSDERN